MRVAEALENLRKSVDLSLEEASALSEDSPEPEILEGWEKGEVVPDLLSLNAYLEVLGFDFHDLQNALEGVDASPEAAPVDWLDEFMEASSDGSDDRLALARTLERLEGMYEDRTPANVRSLKARLELQLDDGDPFRP